MVDLHSHILPGIDDGAADLDAALALLRAQSVQGVTTVVLTPHFNINISTPEAFLNQRARAYEYLSSHIKDIPIKLKLAAEVMFSPDILNINLLPFCIEGTKNILIEFPFTHLPGLLREVFYQLEMSGYTPILAHVERYSYLMRNKEILAALIRSGAYSQINASALLGDLHTKRQILKMIKENLVHVIATDTHSIQNRPPMLRDAMAVINKKLGQDIARQLSQNAVNIAEGVSWIVPEPN